MAAPVWCTATRGSILVLQIELAVCAALLVACGLVLHNGFGSFRAGYFCIETRHAASKNDLERCEKGLKQALQDFSGDKNTDIRYARIEDYLGTALVHQGKYFEAEDYLADALKIRLKTLGENNEATADSLNNVANCIMHEDGSFNRLALAESMMVRAIRIDSITMGKDTEVAAIAKGNLAELYRLQKGRYFEAKSLYLQSLPVMIKKSGGKNKETAIMLSNYGDLLSDMCRFAEAEATYKHSLQLYREIHMEKHPAAMAAMTALAALSVRKHSVPKQIPAIPPGR